ncbi:MAG: DUF4177 domain-containing protein [Muribaculaceae bacterium]|nr:DUF4177 domain-containing protein [Muribaculaceae bacterium]
MSEFFSDAFVSMLGVLWALTILYVVSKLFPPAQKDEEITYEYKFFKYTYTYSEPRKMNEELNALSKEGWEIVSLAGEDHFYAYFILKREIPQTTK